MATINGQENIKGIRISIGRFNVWNLWRIPTHPSTDRGGTFCDVIAQIPGRADLVFKLLSVDPQNYHDAPTEAIRRVLQAVQGRDIPPGEKLDASAVGMYLLHWLLARIEFWQHIRIMSDRNNHCHKCPSRAQGQTICSSHNQGYYAFTQNKESIID